jgi:uncharacterized alkaline shock family protein YloU
MSHRWCLSTGDGGLATAATLWNPTSLDFDNSGNVYICDSLNSRIRKITISTGVISTFAGGCFDNVGATVTCSQTSKRGVTPEGIVLSWLGNGMAATAAALNTPRAIAFNSARTILYIADTFNHRVRKIVMSTDIISTIAGVTELTSITAEANYGSYSGDGGDASLATFNTLSGLDIDADDNVIISDSYNQVIRKIDMTSGIISKISGQEPLSTTNTGENETPILKLTTEVKMWYPQHLHVDRCKYQKIKT